MKRTFLSFIVVATLLSAGLSLRKAFAQSGPNSMIDSFKLVEVASVADAMEQLYGVRAYMAHDMRPLGVSKFAGPAVTVLLQRQENQEGSHAVQGMLDAIDEAAPGSVYVMVLENGLDFAGVGGLMTTAMKFRNLAGAVVDGGIRDTAQITRLQFPIFSRGIVPSTTINHFRLAGKNVAVTCGGVAVQPNDIVVADLDGVAVVPRAKAAEVLARAQQLDNTEHSMMPFIEKYRSLREAVAKFGRL